MESQEYARQVSRDTVPELEVEHEERGVEVPPHERLTARGSCNNEEGQRSAREFRRGAPEHGGDPSAPLVALQLLGASRIRDKGTASEGVMREPPAYQRCTRVNVQEPWSPTAGAEMQQDPNQNVSRSSPRLDGDRSFGLDRLMSRATAVTRAARKFKDLRTHPRLTEETGRKVAHNLDGQQLIGVEFDIPEDSYGAAILAIVKEMQDVYHGHGASATNVLKGVFALVLLAVNLTLQFCILTFIASHVVQPAVYRIQKDYQSFHQESFDEHGVFQPDMWRHYDRKNELCQIGMTSRFFYCVLLFVWVTSMLAEFRASAQLIHQVAQMPLCHQGQDMLRMDEEEKISIIALTRRTRMLMYCFVCIPKIGISMYLLVLGCQWLSATTSFEALVVNTMAMEFVLHVDELLYEAFLPPSYRRQVEDINFFIQERQPTPEEEEWREWSTYVKAFCFLLVGFAVVIVWSDFLQGVLPQDISDVKEHCAVYLNDLSPICGMWGFQSFRACYPFGKGD
mmetsp:Transcript_12992/g.25510  ORF Transcript_12992/g.25510 Transcript_12992/m.25510 type:complete len:510 (+) Transcript_12992:19-1548(+)